MKKDEIKPNSKALLLHLAQAEAKLKKGVSLEEALNRADFMWHNMSYKERDKYRDDLHPRPTRDYTKQLKRLMEKYGKRAA